MHTFKTLYILSDDILRLFFLKEFSFLLFVAYKLLYMISLRRHAIKLLMLSHRAYPCAIIAREVKKRLPLIQQYTHELMPDNVDLSHAANRSIILKESSLENNQSKKGVFLITFTTTLPFLYYRLDMKRFLCDYHLVVEPSSALYCDPNILFLCQYSEPVIIQASEQRDRAFLELIDTNLKPVSFGASDWVDHSIFYPIKDTVKIYDSIYVANYNPIKRLHFYIKTLYRIKYHTQNYKAALVCASWGGYRDYYIELIKKHQLEDIIDLYEDVSQCEVNKLLNQSKVNVLLSLKEGSNRSLFEGFFANTPGIALRKNIGINKDYINQYTGSLILDRDLFSTLLHFRDNYTQYTPREWAMATIAPEVTTNKLVNALNLHCKTSIASNELFIKTNNPEVNYLQKDASLTKKDTLKILSKYLKA